MKKDLEAYLISDLRDRLGIDLDRQELAESLIRGTERDLRRSINDDEARILLASDGRFPEIEEELITNALKAGRAEAATGEYAHKPERIRFGKEILNLIVLGRNKTREGD